MASIVGGGMGSEPVSTDISRSAGESDMNEILMTAAVFSGIPRNGNDTEPFSGMNTGLVSRNVSCTVVEAMIVPSASLSTCNVTTVGIDDEICASTEKYDVFVVDVSNVLGLQERNKIMSSHRNPKSIISRYILFFG